MVLYFDKATITSLNGGSTSVSADDYYKLPLLDRVTALGQGRVQFFKNGQRMAALDALKGPQSPTSTRTGLPPIGRP